MSASWLPDQLLENHQLINTNLLGRKMHTLKIHGLEMKFKSSLKQGRSRSIDVDLKPPVYKRG